MLHADYEETLREFRASKERCKKATAEVNRIADELRQQQEHNLHVEKFRKNLEQQVRELQARIKS